MDVQVQIREHIAGLPEPKQDEIQELHQRILQLLPGSQLWFDNGVNSEGKTVANPTIGYGFQVIRYADGKTRDFFRIGLSANTTGISIYILGLNDKTYGADIGKASVTGYCIKFKKLKDINLDILDAAIRYGAEAPEEKGAAETM
jgi:hypothetical protein